MWRSRRYISAYPPFVQVAAVLRGGVGGQADAALALLDVDKVANPSSMDV